ncbi:MAG: AGE family epimerase/isomerase [Actinomycetia bacterium]|nr:AGE family epimerase/isomerase [Actinomycetes bacterium]
MSVPGAEEWRAEQAQALLATGRRIVRPDGRFGWISDEGTDDETQPRFPYISARMTHVWALAHLNGDAPDGAKIAADGIASFADWADPAHGGWYAALDPAGRPLDRNKAAYEHAHMMLASSSATAAGLPGAAELLAALCETVARWFWSDDEGATLESWNEDFTEPEPYRGANSNMHSVEAYLAAGDVTGDPVWHARALSMAELLINRFARGNGWRIPEHYDAKWHPLPDFNRDRPFDRFRPCGTTPGHSFEWSRLCVNLAATLPDPPSWLVEAAIGLFDTAAADAWAVDGRSGFIYTLDSNHRPLNPARMHWVVCEAIMAADALHRRTGDAHYADIAKPWWAFLDEHIIDHTRGGWWNELSAQLTPTHDSWAGKPDMYHCYQTLLFPSLPSSPCAAVILARRAADGGAGD